MKLTGAGIAKKVTSLGREKIRIAIIDAAYNSTGGATCSVVYDAQGIGCSENESVSTINGGKTLLGPLAGGGTSYLIALVAMTIWIRIRRISQHPPHSNFVSRKTMTHYLWMKLHHSSSNQYSPPRALPPLQFDTAKLEHLIDLPQHGHDEWVILEMYQHIRLPVSPSTTKSSSQKQ